MINKIIDGRDDHAPWWIPLDEQCIECDGTGVVIARYTDGEPMTFTDVRDEVKNLYTICDECNGRGTI